MARHDEFGITRRGFFQGVIGSAVAAKGVGDGSRIDIVTVRV
jgi:hypothetical protein